ncbi:MAG: hypothetical protein HYR83_11000 [Planctomycetes bacterium]|nr:hypothetical protein [Planctomycetota bacterium]
MPDLEIFFSDVFGVSQEELDTYGAFNISLLTDLPLFVDPFLLFNSSKPEYQELHEAIIKYLRFLKAKSEAGLVLSGLIKAWYSFAEVRQNWLGFCATQNSGRGLGNKFAQALNENLVHVFRNFGSEQVTQGSRLEKLCLIREGVGRDMISDFTTNLIKGFLLEYTSQFAQEYLDDQFMAEFPVERAVFDYDRERWYPGKYRLPIHEDDFVLLTPKDILTKDDTWISHNDMIHRFREIPDAVENEELRAEINNYFYSRLPEDKVTKDDEERAIQQTLKRFPAIIDFYIRGREDAGDEAVATSAEKVRESLQLYIKQFGRLAGLLFELTSFYDLAGKTVDETRQRIQFFKDVIENKGGHRLFYDTNGEQIRRESDLQIMFRLVWNGTPSDVSREVHDGRGPADFKISRGSADKTLVEFKLASNTQLRRNLQNQLAVYQSASDAKFGFKVVVYFEEAEFERVQEILQDLGMETDERIILIDARGDNKPSGSKA